MGEDDADNDDDVGGGDVIIRAVGEAEIEDVCVEDTRASSSCFLVMLSDEALFMALSLSL